jgi:hypothetical protein
MGYEAAGITDYGAHIFANTEADGFRARHPNSALGEESRLALDERAVFLVDKRIGCGWAGTRIRCDTALIKSDVGTFAPENGLADVVAAQGSIRHGQ